MSPAAIPVSHPLSATRRHPAPLAAAGLRRAARYQPPTPPRPRAYVPVALGRVVRDVICEMYLLTPAQLVGPGRESDVVEARQLAAQLLYERDLGLSVIGRFLGRDHATVNHALEQLEEHMAGCQWQALLMARHEVRRRLAQLPRGAQI